MIMNRLLDSLETTAITDLLLISRETRRDSRLYLLIILK